FLYWPKLSNTSLVPTLPPGPGGSSTLRGVNFPAIAASAPLVDELAWNMAAFCDTHTLSPTLTPGPGTAATLCFWYSDHSHVYASRLFGWSIRLFLAPKIGSTSSTPQARCRQIEAWL